MFGDKIQIRNLNKELEVNTNFEDCYNDTIYTVIDKQSLGENIARNILDDEPDLDFEDNCHIIFEEIDKEIINDIVNDIFNYALEYWNNNI